MKDLFIALRLFTVLTVLTGVIYPLIVTGVGQAAFKHQANGSLIVVNNEVFGSELIGQDFKDPKYFWARPSATGTFPYNPMASGGSNLGPLNPKLIGGNGVRGAIRERMDALFHAGPHSESVPTELVTSSASGLDPHISMKAAEFQIERVAKSRGLSEDEVRKVVAEASTGRTFGFLGEPVVNVLRLNLLLDKKIQ